MNPAIAALIEKRKLAATPFPLKALLVLYTKDNKKELYINYFAGFKALVSWLAPINTASKFKPQKIFSPLYTYEIQEIATILKIHPSIIQQEFMEIYTSCQKQISES